MELKINMYERVEHAETLGMEGVMAVKRATDAFIDLLRALRLRESTISKRSVSVL